MRKIIISILAVILAVGASFGIGLTSESASAHSPGGSGDCSGVVASMSNAPSNFKSTVTIWVDGVKKYGPSQVSGNFTHSASVPNDFDSHTWRVLIVNDGYGLDKSGEVGPCKDDNGNAKISYCHNDNNPHIITTSMAAFFNSGHIDHEGDIYPAGSFRDQSWPARGDQSLLSSDCKKPTDWNWQYTVSCTGISGTNPNGPIDSVDANVRIKNLITGEVRTFNYHPNTSGPASFNWTFAGQFNVSLSYYEVQWVQVNGTNYHWEGSLVCGDEPPELIVPQIPTPKDVCGTVADRYGIPDGPVGVVYSRDDNKAIIAEISGNVEWGVMPAGWVRVNDTVARYDFDPAKFTNEPCTEQPEPKVTYTEWVDGEFACEDTTVEQTRTKVTTPWVYVGEDWVEDTVNAVAVTENQVRDLTTDEQTVCETETPTPTPTPTEPPTDTPTPSDTPTVPTEDPTTAVGTPTQTAIPHPTKDSTPTPLNSVARHSLPNTGGPNVWLLLGAITLIAAGVSLILVVRDRNRQH